MGRCLGVASARVGLGLRQWVASAVAQGEGQDEGEPVGDATDPVPGDGGQAGGFVFIVS